MFAFCYFSNVFLTLLSLISFWISIFYYQIPIPIFNINYIHAQLSISIDRLIQSIIQLIIFYVVLVFRKHPSLCASNSWHFTLHEGNAHLLGLRFWVYKQPNSAPMYHKWKFSIPTGPPCGQGSLLMEDSLMSNPKTWFSNSLTIIVTCAP